MPQLAFANDSLEASSSITSSYRTTLNLHVNGVPVVAENADPAATLLGFLRKKGLTGTKLGCGEGGCE